MGPTGSTRTILPTHNGSLCFLSTKTVYVEKEKRDSSLHVLTNSNLNLKLNKTMAKSLCRKRHDHEHGEKVIAHSTASMSVVTRLLQPSLEKRSLMFSYSLLILHFCVVF